MAFISELYQRSQSRIRFLNWSISHGDLRVAHFVGMHALPLAGFYLFDSSRALILFGLCYGILATLAFVQALMGLPLFKID